MMECTPRYNTGDTPVIYWAGIPGNAGDFPSEESRRIPSWNRPYVPLCRRGQLRELAQSVRHPADRPPKRDTGACGYFPDLPMKKGIITNRSKFILSGPSGSGNSLFHQPPCPPILRMGAHILLVDTGSSY
ncbi:hypothetical protein NXW50_05225 [Bacteroides thetaiotaomicron]|nr:hypothetical protein [Bacteroides thetaiotaomicron]MCS2277643.1 hypothetical protein [Bacteroides thetaiotaomicron]